MIRNFFEMINTSPNLKWHLKGNRCQLIDLINYDISYDISYNIN